MANEGFVRVRAKPGAPKTRVVGAYGEDCWKVAIAGRADRGEANSRLLRFIAGLVGVEVDQVRIVSGGSARDKIIAVQGISSLDLGTAFADADVSDDRTKADDES